MFLVKAMRLLVTAFTAVLIVVTFQPANAEDSQPSPEVRMQTKLPSWDPAASGTWDGSWLMGANFEGGHSLGAPSPIIQNTGESSFCDKLDKECLSNSSLIIRGYAGVCNGTTFHSACIESLEIRVGDGDWVGAEYVETWNSSPTQASFDWFEVHSKADLGLGKVLDISRSSGWPEPSDHSAPASNPGPLLFSVPGLENAAGSTNYLVNLGFFAQVNGTNKTTKYFDFDISTTPVLVQNAPEAHVGVEVVTQAEGQQPAFGGTGPGFRGADFVSSGKVAYAVRFSDDVEVRLRVQVPKLIGGWFHSRLSEPALEIQGLSPELNLMTITAKPAEIPMTNIFVPGFDPKYQELVEKYESPYWLEWRRKRLAAGEQVGGVTGISWGPNSGVHTFRDWYPLMDERAKGSAQTWLVSMMPVDRLGNNRCLNDTSSVQGLINTNAMVYQSQIPTYIDGFLTYEVAGVHRAMDGSLNLGEYDLQIRSEAARCLYGYSAAPVSGTVAVVGNDGEENVATTVVSEKDGWLKLSARGFTFSEKEIKAQITQPQSRTLTKHLGMTTVLTAKQKAEIKALVSKSAGNELFTCMGLVLQSQSSAAKSLASQRARVACAYVKTLNPQAKTIVQIKITKAASYSGRVMVSSR